MDFYRPYRVTGYVMKSKASLWNGKSERKKVFLARKRQKRNVTEGDAIRDSAQGQMWDILIGILSQPLSCSHHLHKIDRQDWRKDKEWIASNIFRTAPSKENNWKIRCFVLFTRARHWELFTSRLELQIIRCKWWSSDDKDSHIARGNDSSAILACLGYKARTLDKRESTRSTDQHRKFYWGLSTNLSSI